MTAQRIGVMGGTFDPIHLGHLRAAAAVADSLDLDRVIFVPAREPWHRGEPPGASADDRFEMTRLAVVIDPRFAVSRVDLERPGPTFTIDTLADLQGANPLDLASSGDEWFFITGADALAGFMTWRDPLGILELAHLVGVTRPGHALQATELPTESCTLVEAPGLDISSTQVRERVREGADIADLVPRAVADYIAERGLYAKRAS